MLILNDSDSQAGPTSASAFPVANANVVPQPQPVALTPPRTPTPSPPSSNNIGDMCQCMGIDSTAVDAAHYKRKRQPLLHLVRNFEGMKRVLEMLGFSNRGQRGRPETVTALGSQFVVTTSEVLSHFEWSQKTYENKAMIFTWARENATKEWDSHQSKGLLYI